MPLFRRAFCPGGTFFFTLVTENRAPILCEDVSRPLLHQAILQCASQRAFVLEAMVLLPDHLHLLVTLPGDDADFSTRIAATKANFTRSYLMGGGVEQPRSTARVARRRRGVWQRWFWEHVIRDEEDFEKHLNYIHWNPVKHNVAKCPHEWPYSTFPKWVHKEVYDRHWQCACDGRIVTAPCFADLALDKME